MGKKAAMKKTSSYDGDLIDTLRRRFESSMSRHPGIEWSTVKVRLELHARKLAVVHAMEETGGEPDVTGCDSRTGELIFCDCSEESPSGRRSLCYDQEGLDARKEHKPVTNAVDMAAVIGIELLTEVQYRELQKLGPFDRKTSSWLQTPDAIRQLGGALFGDFRYGQVFVYHNGAQSYYAVRGFRGLVRV